MSVVLHSTKTWSLTLKEQQNKKKYIYLSTLLEITRPNLINLHYI